MGFRGEGRISQFKPKRGEVVISDWDSVLCKGHKRERSWEAGETVYHKGEFIPLGESYQELAFTLGCYLGHVLIGGTSVGSRALQAT